MDFVPISEYESSIWKNENYICGKKTKNSVLLTSKVGGFHVLSSRLRPQG